MFTMFRQNTLFQNKMDSPWQNNQQRMPYVQSDIYSQYNNGYHSTRGQCTNNVIIPNISGGSKISPARRPQFLRLDSTGEANLKGIKVDTANTPFSFSACESKTPSMFRSPSNRDVGFGQKYAQRKAWTQRNFKGHQSQVQGYPFYEFAMAASPIDKSVKFVGFHGDSQILNLAQLGVGMSEPQRSPHRDYKKPKAQLGVGMSEPRRSPHRDNKKPKTPFVEMNKNTTPERDTTPEDSEMSLCNEVDKMSLHSTPTAEVYTDYTRESCPVITNLSTLQSEQLDSLDSGISDSFPSPVMDTAPGDEIFTDTSESETHQNSDEDMEFSAMNFSIDVDCNSDSTSTSLAADFSISSTLVPVIGFDYDTDSDSDSDLVNIADHFTFFDSDDEDSEDDNDPCSASAEFGIIACFFPDDPYSPMNFNNTCSVNINLSSGQKRVSTSQACEDGLSESSNSSKRVRFVSDSKLEEIHQEDVTLADDYRSARCGPWEDYARGRDRFLRRIQDLDPIISPCLEQGHRCKMYTLLHSLISST